MKKYFAIFAAVALLGMLAIYFPSKKTVSSTTTTTQAASATPNSSTTNQSNNTATSSSTTPAASSNTSASSSSTSSNSGTYKNGTYTGSSVSTRFGTVKVAITVSGGEITNVDFLSLPSEDMRSSMISSQASPLLESQTLSAQSANIDGVSGATYTSQGYVESLQAAIDAARV